MDLEWQTLVGKAILRFGDIELVSLHCLAHIPTDRSPRSPEATARLKFSQRVDLLVETLGSRSEMNQSMKELLKGFKRAKELAEIRNLIAHNPVMLDIYTNTNTEDVFTEHTIRAARAGGRTLNIDQLKEFVAEVEDLSSSLLLLFSQTFCSTDVFFRTHSSNTPT